LSIRAEDVVKLFEEDARARKRLAELLVSEPDVRLVLINAVLRDVATRGDVERLRGELESFRREIYAQISELRERVSRLEGALSQLVERIGDLDKRIDALDKRIEALDKRIDALDKRMDALDKRMDYVTRVSWLLAGSVLATLVAQLIVHAITR